MNLFSAIIFLLSGLALLLRSADWLVDGAVGIAKRFGLSPLIIGLTIVAMGTSAPEVAGSISAAIQNYGDTAIGNVYGSNIANLALIGGICALICPITVKSSMIRREIPIMLFVALLLWPIFALDSYLGRNESIVLLIIFFSLIVFTIYAGLKDAKVQSDDVAEANEHLRQTKNSLTRNIVLVVIGLAGLSIGALTLIKDLEKSLIIRQQYPLLFEAARSIASPHIRNMATIGGNLCQETRCWYYRRPPDTGISFNCQRKSGEGVCYAVNGENQYHGITGPAPCVSVCPSDLATVFLAMDARLKIERQDGSRFMGVKELYTNLATTLKPGEVISFVQIPKIAHEAKQRFLKFRRRKTIDFAIASVGAVLHLDEKKVVRDARLAIGGVSYRPVRAHEAEQILIGEPLTEKIAEKASEAAVSGFHPLSKNAYKVQIVKTLMKRAIMS